MLDLLASKEHIEPGRAVLVRTALDFAFRAGSYTDLADRIDDLEVEAQRREEEGPSQRFGNSNRFDEDRAEAA